MSEGGEGVPGGFCRKLGVWGHGPWLWALLAAVAALNSESTDSLVHPQEVAAPRPHSPLPITSPTRPPTSRSLF